MCDARNMKYTVINRKVDRFPNIITQANFIDPIFLGLLRHTCGYKIANVAM